jgi:hypothetical protein
VGQHLAEDAVIDVVHRLIGRPDAGGSLGILAGQSIDGELQELHLILQAMNGKKQIEFLIY